MKAAQESTPDLEDDDPRAVKLMVDYLYLHDYDPRTAIALVPVLIDEDYKEEESTDRAAEVEQAVDVSVDGTVEMNVADDIWGFGSVAKKGKKGKKIMKRPHMWQPEPEPQPESETVPGSMFGGYHLPTDSADAAPSTVQGHLSFLEMHAKVFAIASKYDIRSLECVARKKFKDETQRSWEIVDLIAAIHVVFNLTPDGEFELRNILKDTIVRHALTLVQYPDFEDAVAGIGGLAYDLFRRKTYTRR